jgi:signal transduction histidine kinase
MTARREWPDWTGRRGPLVAEITALVLFTALDVVFAVRAAAVSGYLESIAASSASGFGVVAAVLAVSRRRLPDRVAVLGFAVTALSLLVTALTVLAAAVDTRPPLAPDATETVALALLVGAACRRLVPVQALSVALSGGAAMVLAPVLRDGTDNRLALLAVPAALLWGGALAVGLMQRDADARRADALAGARERVRTAERMLMARELHDLVAHHITGVVVRAQAARVIAGSRNAAPDTHGDIFAEIEQAGAEALAATRRLVAVLRTGQDARFTSPSGIVDAVDRAIPDDGTVTLTTADGLGELPVTPEAAGAVHRVIMEALTNVRRHAPHATDIRVDVRVSRDDGGDWLVVDIVNDGVGHPQAQGREGYGLVGMTERVTALGGTVSVGRQPDARWRVLAKVPVGTEATS